MTAELRRPIVNVAQETGHPVPAAPQRAAERREVPLAAGVSILRFVSSRAPTPPHVHVSLIEPQISDLICVDGAAASAMLLPGEGIAIRAQRATRLCVEVVPAKLGGSRDAELALEPLAHLSASAGGATVAPGGTSQMRPHPAPAVPTLALRGHVAHRGDVAAKPGQWLCGPDAPGLIEGFSVLWSERPAALDLAIGCSVKRPGAAPEVLPPQRGDVFFGTRGRATAIVGLGLSLDGPGARGFEIACTALFLNAPAIERRGRAIALEGPEGTAPLVGLKLALVRAEEAALPPPAPAPEIARPVTGRWDNVGRVRVFRSAAGQ